MSIKIGIMINFLKKVFWYLGDLDRGEFTMIITFPFLGLTLLFISFRSILSSSLNIDSIWMIIALILGISFLGLSYLYGKNRK